jgi:hypothetical protein
MRAKLSVKSVGQRVVLGILVVFSVSVHLASKAPSASAQTEVSPFAGEWDFSSTGDDPGSGKASVDNDGAITGTGVTPDGTFAFIGSPNGSASTRATFTGRVTAPNLASGTWVNTFANMTGKWDARRMVTPTDNPLATVATIVPDKPKDTVPTTDSLDGVVVGEDPAWKTFRSPGSFLRCHVERGINSRNWSNLRGGIRFSWPKNGRFSLEIANNTVPNAVGYAHFYFEAVNLKLGGQWATTEKSQRKSRFVYDMLPSIAPKPSRILRGQFEEIYITLREGTKLYSRAVGTVEFSHPGVAGYCNFDLRVTSKP